MNNRDKFIKFLYTLYDHVQISQDFDAIPRDYGIDQKLYINEAHTLAHIYKNEGITLSEVAEIECKTLSALSQKIKKLQNKKLIRKERNPIDYKKFNLYVTDLGKIVCENQEKMDNLFFDTLISKITNWDTVDFDEIGEIITLISQQKLDEMVTLKHK